jgi:hypothetical protein
MKRIAVFTFHHRVGLARERLRQLRQLNPEVPIAVVWGGPAPLFRLIQQSLLTHLEDDVTSIHCLRGHTRRWKWKNSDLALRDWHRAVGRELDWDVAHVVQWDLLLAAPLRELYAEIPADAVALSGLVPLSQVSERWAWTTLPRLRGDSMRLLRHVEHAHGYADEPHACIGPGMTVPRAFLDRYAEIDPPDFGHDELRLPLYAQILGFTLHDTGMFRSWFDPNEARLFNADRHEIALTAIRSELADAAGRRAFHPVRRSVDLHLLPRTPAASLAS